MKMKRELDDESEVNGYCSGKSQGASLSSRRKRQMMES